MNGNSGGRQFDDWAKVASWKGTGATTFFENCSRKKVRVALNLGTRKLCLNFTSSNGAGSKEVLKLAKFRFLPQLSQLSFQE